MTDWIAQMAKPIASAPHRTMIHRAVIDYPRTDIGRTGAPPGSMDALRNLTLGGPASFRRGHCQKRPRHAMAQLPEHRRLGARASRPPAAKNTSLVKKERAGRPLPAFIKSGRDGRAPSSAP